MSKSSGKGVDSRPASTQSSQVETFLEQVRKAPAQHELRRGRLVFALDATMSRQPTWDIAQGVQARMFDTAGRLGGLDVQLVYFRGFSECRASSFIADGKGLAAAMAKIGVRGGRTQIEKVLRHVLTESRKQPIGALIYIGDAIEEDADALCALAGELGLRGVKAFMFHEGHDREAGAVFAEIARLSGGAYATFDHRAPNRLAELLSAAAAYAAGGRAALESQARQGGAAARALLTQMK